MKKTLTFLIIIGFVLAIVGPVSAETVETEAQLNKSVTLPSQPLIIEASQQSEPIPSAIVKSTRLSWVKARGHWYIVQRLNSLNALSKRVDASKLTTEQKVKLVAMVDANVVGLKALDEQIKSATELKVAQDLVKKIFTDFRIYAVFTPEINLMRSLYGQTNHVTKLDEVFAKVQSRIDAAKVKGKDMTARQTALDSAKAMVPGIITKINETLVKVETLKPADYPDVSKTAINSYRTAIKEIQTMFKKVNQLLWGTKLVKS